MTETAKRRRRWPGIVLAAVLLPVCGSMAWRFRPLNTVERAMVGHWTFLATSAETRASFSTDRTFKMDEVVGSWSVSGSTLWLRTPFTFAQTAGLPWHGRLSLFIGSRFATGSAQIQWDSPDQFILKEGQFSDRATVFRRATAEPPVADRPPAPLE